MAEVRQRAHYQVTFAVLAAGVAAFALLQSLVIPVLTTVQHELHTTQDAVTWVLTAYLLSASVFTPILGRVGDMVGKERIFVVSLAALAAGSLLAAIAPSIGVMIVARVIQGAGGGMLPVAFGIIRDEFPAAKVAGAVGALAALTAVGGGLGIVLAGPIEEALNYHWLFWLPMILTIAAGISAVFFVPESPVRAPGRISWPPAVLLSGWLVALLVAVSEAPSWGWGSARVIGLLAAAVVLAAGWVARGAARADPADRHEDDAAHGGVDEQPRRAAHRPRHVRDVRLPARVRADAAQRRVRVRREHHPLRAAAAALLGHHVPHRNVRGPARRRLGGKVLVVTGCLIGALSMAILAFAHQHEWQIYLANALQGIGFGLAFAAMSALVVAAVPPSQTGVASGMNANIRTIGGSIGSAVMASIVTSQLQPSGLPKESGYTAGFAVMTAMLVLAALAGLLIPAVRRPGRPGEPEQAGEAVTSAGTLADYKPVTGSAGRSEDG